MELRDAGVPDTGPKRPRDKKIVSLTPASVTRARMEPRASGGKSRERRGRRGGRGRGRASPRGEIRIRTASSPIGPTPRTQLRNDIRDLINSECLHRYLSEVVKLKFSHSCRLPFLNSRFSTNYFKNQKFRDSSFFC